MNLGTYLARSARHWPDRTALVCGERTWTYRELDQRTDRLAAALIDGLDLRPGDAVASLAWNCGELVEIEFALYKAGLVRVPVNARLGAEELRHVLRDSGARVLVHDAAHDDDASAAAGPGQVRVLLGSPGADRAAATPVGYDDLVAGGDLRPVAVEVGADDPAVLNYTSGSTGALKAAVQTFGNRLANMRKQLMSPESRPRPDTRYLACGPITHATGMVLLSGVFGGSTTHVLRSWSPAAFLDAVEQERITATFLVPAMLTAVLDHPGAAGRDLSSLTSVRIGGAPVPPQRLRAAVDLFGPVVALGYGLAETTSVVAGLAGDELAAAVEGDPELLRSCGRAAYDSEVRVVGEDGADLPPREVGEIVVRGPDCVTRYWNEPELSASAFRDGWVHTGDLAWMREDGYLFIVDRKKDMIISGGFNIYCTEVEAALHEHPAVQEACVVGVPDERWGEAVLAVVVPRPGHRPTEQELIAFCAERLGRFKKPRSVEFVAGLPLNRNGKIDRKAVREPHWAGADRRVN